MIPSERPIKLIHVSAFAGSRSLWFRWITRASDYRSLQKRLQLPLGNPRCIRHNSPEMVCSAQLCGRVSTASPLSSVVSPSRPSVGPFTPSLNLRHCTAMLSLRRARRIRYFVCARASHPPLSSPAPRPLSLRPRVASALFFAPLPPPLRTPCKSRCTHVPFVSRCVPCSSPSPPQPQPGCSLISFSFLEAPTVLRCRPPPACGGAPGAVRVFFADHCFVLRTIRQR